MIASLYYHMRTVNELFTYNIVGVLAYLRLIPVRFVVCKLMGLFSGSLPCSVSIVYYLYKYISIGKINKVVQVYL